MSEACTSARLVSHRQEWDCLPLNVHFHHLDGPHELELYQLVLGQEVDIWDSRPIAARGESAIGAVRGKHAARQDGPGTGEASVTVYSI